MGIKVEENALHVSVDGLFKTEKRQSNTDSRVKFVLYKRSSFLGFKYWKLLEEGSYLDTVQREREERGFED